MASAPQANLPLFYQDLMPLNTRDHATWKARGAQSAPWLIGQHAIPLTVEEFPQAVHAGESSPALPRRNRKKSGGRSGNFSPSPFGRRRA